jgi:flagellar hook-length control protein FliK
MNAIPRVPAAQANSEAPPLNAGTPAAAPTPGSGNQDFAGALSDATGTPAHKSAGNKAGATALGGDQLPPAGNHSPPAPPAPPAPTSLVAVPPASPQTSAARTQPGAPAVDVAAAAVAQPPAAQGIGLTPIKDEGDQDSSSASAPLAAPVPPPGSAPVVAAPLSPPAASAEAAFAAQVERGTDGLAKTTSGIAAPRGGPSASTAPTASTASTASTAPTTPTAPAVPGSATTAQGDATQLSLIAAAVVNAAGPSSRDAPSTPDEAAATPTGMQTGVPAGAPAQDAAQAPSPAALAAVAAQRPVAAAILAAAGAVAGAAGKHATVGGVDSSSAADPSGGQAMAAQLAGSSSASADTAPVPTMKVAAPVDSGDFGQGVADRVSLMVDNNLTNARLQVNPPSLGPIEVRIALQDGRAQVWLTSHSALTRDALESGSPQLREMLSAQGFSQVSVDISQRSFQERSAQSQTYDAAPAAEHGAKSAQVPATRSISRAASGVVDAYA